MTFKKPAATLAAVLSAFGTAAAQTVPNPITISYGFKGPDKQYAVTCLSARSEPGTWIRIATSTTTTQQALIYRPPSAPTEPPQTGPSILYCDGADGKAGIISGAPAGMILPVEAFFRRTA